MRARATSWRMILLKGMWFIPAVSTLLAIALAVVLVRLDRVLRFDQRSDLPWWLFGGGPEGIREVLSTIAGTTITVTGVVFSITIVALQLASSQFSPLVLGIFRSNRGNQVVLAFFISTFTYSLLVLRSVLSPEQDNDAFVPVIATSGAIALALVSVAMLIYFVHHASQSIQASTIVKRASQDTLTLIRNLYPEDIGEPAESDPTPARPVGDGMTVLAVRGGYFQAVDGDTLFDLSEEETLTVHVERTPGDYILPGSVLATVWPRDSVEDETKDKIRTAFLIGSERTLQSDVELGVRQISDIAIKALSPGINDPTTAMLCIDQLSEALVYLGRRQRPSYLRSGGDGNVRVALIGPSFDRLVDLAFTQIRQYGANDPALESHLAATLGRITAMIPAHRRDPLVRQARLVVETARSGLSTESDIERVAHAASWIEQVNEPDPDPAFRGAYGLPSSDPALLKRDPQTNETYHTDFG